MSPTIVLCTPHHKNDKLTEFFIRIADGINVASGKKVIRPVIETPTKYSELVASLNLPEDCILIFVGHGKEDSLLGPPKPDSVDKTVFYNSDQFPHGPGSMFAFCCSSAVNLGPEFKKIGSRTFLGYAKEINFVLAKGQCTNWWKTILHALALDVISNERVSVTARALAEKQYLDAYNYFTSGAGTDDEYAPLMAVFLIDQYRALRVLSE